MIKLKPAIRALTLSLIFSFSHLSWAINVKLKPVYQDDKVPEVLSASINDIIKHHLDVKSSEQISSEVEPIRLKISQMLVSNGYYRNNVQFKVNEETKGKFLVPIQIHLGAPIKVAAIKIKHSATTNFDEINDLAIQVNENLIAQNVIQSAEQIAKKVETSNCFTSVVVEHQAVIDFDTSMAVLYYMILEQPQVFYGRTSIEGLDSVLPVYIQRQIPWQPGECFQLNQVQALEKKLRQSVLFSSADILYPVENNKDNEQIPLTIQVQESLQRTFKIGVGYESDDGPGIYSSWNHRNYFGKAENLEISSKASPINQFLKVGYTNPYFYSPNRKLNSNIDINHIDSDQYDTLNLNIDSIISQSLENNWSFQYGLGYRLSTVKEGSENESFGLVYIPLALNYDSRNDILDPRKGMYFKLSGAPYWDSLGHADNFLKIKVNLQNYFAFGSNDYTVIATRVSLGSIIGASAKKIPADLRYYAGGGKSVRGYEYQSLGERVNNEAIGGRSLIELSTELRQQFSDSYGGVVFIDGGNVYEKNRPDLNKTIRWALGVGFRYYTTFGPIRVDVATPVNKRKDIDKSFQLYMSIGQSF